MDTVERDKRLNIPVSKAELAAAKQSAVAAGVSLSNWVRQTLAGRHITITEAELAKYRRAAIEAGYSTVDEYIRRVLAGHQPVVELAPEPVRARKRAARG